MIIQCQSCSSKFIVKDSDIPDGGRTVQCSNCSVQWLQLPVIASSDDIQQDDNEVVKQDDNEVVLQDDNEVVQQDDSRQELEASDGKKYKYLGMQWAELLPSGNTGKLAKKKISNELNKRAGIQTSEKVRKIDKRGKYKSKKRDLDPSSKVIDPSSEKISAEESKKGLGFFGYIFVIIIIIVSISGVLKTFENDLTNHFPETEIIFELLNEQLIYVSETFKNMMVIVKDLINSY